MRFLILPLFLVLLACSFSSGAEPGSDGVGPSGSPPVSRVVDAIPLAPTATAWPTFTPAPTLTPTLAPTVTPVPTRVYIPPTPVPADYPAEAVPEVSPELRVEVMAAPTAPEPTPELVVVPSPTPYGKVRGADVHFIHQGLYPYQGGDPPDYIADSAWDKLPPSFDTLLQSTPYALWVVVFDAVDAPDGWSMLGTLRWVNLNTGGVEPVLMYERSQAITKEHPFFARALGRDTAGLWQPGEYRVEFLDDRNELLVDWNFRVR